MGPSPEGGIYHKPGTEDFTDNRRHESQTLRTRYAASVFKGITLLAEKRERQNGNKPQNPAKMEAFGQNLRFLTTTTE